MKPLFLIAFMSIAITLSAQDAPKPEPLYPEGKIPYSKVTTKELGEFETPLIYPFPKAGLDAEDVVFLVIPGGGYAHVAKQHEGFDVAKRLNENNYTAYVLVYRLPNDSLMTNKKFVPLQDAITAVETIHERHPDKKIAVLGFSAGGHLTATVSNTNGSENIQLKSNKPPKISYSILAYPVISMNDEITHNGSKNNLIGANASAEETDYFSIEKRVSKNTPPTFIMHAEDDKAVPIENTHRYIQALKDQHIPFESYIYTAGGHGFGLVNKQETGDWFGKMINWIKNN